MNRIWRELVMSSFAKILRSGGDLGMNGTSGLQWKDILNALTAFVIAMLVIVILLVIFQLVIFTVLNAKCRKFRIKTVKENFKGMKVLGNIVEVLLIIDVAAFLISANAFGALINDLSAGEFNAGVLIAALLPGLLFGYGIFTWVRFLKSKKLYDHMFPKTERKAERKLYDSASLFGDSKDPLEEQAKRKTEEKEIRNIQNDQNIQSVQSVQNVQGISAPNEIIGMAEEADDIVIPDMEKILTPSASDTGKKACPFCGYLSAEESVRCEFCGAEIK